jgi:hypothetical protein
VRENIASEFTAEFSDVKSLLGHIFLDYKVVSELYSEGHIEHKIINELMLRLFVVPLVIIII